MINDRIRIQSRAFRIHNFKVSLVVFIGGLQPVHKTNQAKVNSLRHSKTSHSTCMFWAVLQLRIRDVYPGSWFSSIPEPAVKKAPDPGSESASLGLGYSLLVGGCIKPILSVWCIIGFHIGTNFKSYISWSIDMQAKNFKISVDMVYTVLLYSVIIIESTLYFHFLCLWRRIAGQA